MESSLFVLLSSPRVKSSQAPKGPEVWDQPQAFKRTEEDRAVPGHTAYLHLVGLVLTLPRVHLFNSQINPMK